MNQVIYAIKQRRSIRKYQDIEPTKEEIVRREVQS